MSCSSRRFLTSGQSRAPWALRRGALAALLLSTFACGEEWGDWEPEGDAGGSGKRARDGGSQRDASIDAGPKDVPGPTPGPDGSVPDDRALDASVPDRPVPDASVPDAFVPDAGGGWKPPPTNDYAAPGPFATTTESNVGPDGKCVIYRPKTLGENGFLHPPIVFGPGIGMQASQLKDLLLSFATHGFVVIGTGVLNGGPGAAANRNAMTSALDWLIQQNGRAGTYQGKLDVKHAVAMGYSVGGTAAVEIGAHQAVATTVSIHGHTATSALHGPMLQTSGTKDNVGLPMQKQTFEKSQVQTFLGIVSNADHGYIQGASGGVQRPAIIAWMRYWLYGDTGARRFFWGDDCVLCTSPWVDPQRKNWK